MIKATNSSCLLPASSNHLTHAQTHTHTNFGAGSLAEKMLAKCFSNFNAIEFQQVVRIPLGTGVGTQHQPRISDSPCPELFLPCVHTPSHCSINGASNSLSCFQRRYDITSTGSRALQPENLKKKF